MFKLYLIILNYKFYLNLNLLFHEKNLGKNKFKFYQNAI